MIGQSIKHSDMIGYSNPQASFSCGSVLESMCPAAVAEVPRGVAVQVLHLKANF
jgi:hypothetical protein